VPALLTFTLCAAPLLTALISLFIGPSEIISPADVFALFQHYFLSGALPDDERLLLTATVVMDIRLPRILLALLVGAALSLSGASLQGLFRNPLVSPDVLGLTAGAAFGAALALATSYLPLQVSAFVGGMTAVGITYGIAYSRQGVSVVTLSLAGVIISGLFTALLTIVQFLADPFRLQTIVQWTMGNLHTAKWSKVSSSAPPIILSAVWMLLMRWRLNVLALGDEEARAVGMNPEREKVLVLLPATLAASAAVAVAGIIGMVGLSLPHFARLLVGADNRRLMPVTASLGAVFLLIVDDFSRSLAAYELPVGIFTILIGAPFFIVLLRKKLRWAGS
jgi:iron complex transport system permease protein